VAVRVNGVCFGMVKFDPALTTGGALFAAVTVPQVVPRPVFT
jgi:hypothetical protein